MTLLEMLKIAGMLVVLLLALAVLKMLSQFEYELRKDEVKYEVVWEDGFEDSSLDTLWSSDPRQYTVSDGVLQMTPEAEVISLDIYPDMTQDTTYLEASLKWPDKAFYHAIISIVEVGGNVIPMMDNDKNTSDFTFLTSHKILCKNCHHINIKTYLKDTTNTKPFSKSVFQIDHLSLKSKVQQEKLF